MLYRATALLLLLLTFAQIPGCHFYIRAMPDIIISSEPIPPPETSHHAEQP